MPLLKNGFLEKNWNLACRVILSIYTFYVIFKQIWACHRSRPSYLNFPKIFHRGRIYFKWRSPFLYFENAKYDSQILPNFSQEYIRSLQNKKQNFSQNGCGLKMAYLFSIISEVLIFSRLAMYSWQRSCGLWSITPKGVLWGIIYWCNL